MKKLGYALGVLVLVLVLLLGFLTLVEYRPEDIEEIATDSFKAIDKDELSFISLNIGYGALGKDEDFFMDGGVKVMPDNKKVVEDHLVGIQQILKDNPSDFYLIQEVDRDSKRSFGINQADLIEDTLNLESNFALNYKAFYVPYPWPTIGKVDSGLQTLSDYRPISAYRKSLPVPFKWPVRTVNLKRSLLVEEYELDGRDEKFVLINVHLEAYDDGQGKIEQSKALVELAETYYNEGHYVLIGGDWNQVFPGGEIYPEQSPDLWQGGLLVEEDLPQEWRYAADPSTATCRSNHAPYEGHEDHQLYLIDGYLLSPNLELLEVETLDCGFVYTDHNPVTLRVKLK